MANRHLSRSLVLQALFEWDFSGKPADTLNAIIDRDTLEFAPGHTDQEFMHNLGETVARKISIIDDIIVKAAPEWPLEKISNVDRNILRMGLAELLFGDREQVPPKVAINEAIELAKNFGGENSSKFVNGVLGAVYKEIGEPGKDQVSRPKTPRAMLPDEPIDISKLPVEAKAGAIIFCEHEAKKMIALAHDVFGYWTILKGGAEENETAEQTAIREIKEKIDINVELVETLGSIEYVASHPEKGKILKRVTYFLAKGDYKELEIKNSGGLDMAQWFPLNEVVDLTIYDDIVPLIAKAVEIISQ